MATTVSRTVDFINHDPWDYLYQYGSEVSSDIYNYEDFEQFLLEDMEEEFDEWLNEEYSAAKLLRAMRNCKYGAEEFYSDLLDDWVSYVLDNAEKYGWYFILKEDEDDEE
jgi:hypothetical protein